MAKCYKVSIDSRKVSIGDPSASAGDRPTPESYPLAIVACQFGNKFPVLSDCGSIDANFLP